MFVVKQKGQRFYNVIVDAYFLGMWVKVEMRSRVVAGSFFVELTSFLNVSLGQRVWLWSR